MDGKKKGINFLSEKEKTEYRYRQRNFQLVFLDICLNAACGCDGFLCRDEDECDWTLDGAESVQWTEYILEQTDL